VFLCTKANDMGVHSCESLHMHLKLTCVVYLPRPVHAQQCRQLCAPASALHGMQVGEAVHARVTVERVSGGRVVFATACFTAAGELLLDGQAIALVRS